MGLRNENRFQFMIYNLAKSLALVDNASWEKVKVLFSYCPQITNDHFRIYPYSLDCIIALGTYYIESKYSHTEKILPYLLNLLKGLSSAEWSEENNSDVPFAEKFVFCLNTLLSQISIDLKDDIFVYQTNEIINVSSSIIIDLKNGLSNSDQVKHFYSVKLPIFLGLAQSMIRYDEQEKSYFCYMFPKQRAHVGIIYRIKANYELGHINLLSAVCKQVGEINTKLCSHTFKTKCCVYPLQNVMNVIGVIHVLLSEEVLLKFEGTSNNLCPSSMSTFYYRNCSEIVKCAAMLLYRDILYQQSDIPDYIDNIRDFIDGVYSSVQKCDSIKSSQSSAVNCDEFTYQELKVKVLTKVICLEMLARIVKDVHSAENLCTRATSLLKYKQSDYRILTINSPFIICCMNVLGMLAERFPSISDICIISLQEFLSSPSFTLSSLYKNSLFREIIYTINEKNVSKATWFEYCIFKKVQNSAIENLCSALLSIYNVDAYFMPAFLTKFSSLLFMEKSHPFYALIIEDVVLTLGHISHSIPDFSLTILQCFQQRLHRHSIESDIAIVYQLGHTLMCSDNMEMFQGALKTFSNLILELNVDSEKKLEHISNNLFPVLASVAEKLQEQPKISAIFIRFLELFVQGGLDELRNSVPSVNQENQTIKTNQEKLLHITALLSKKLQSIQFKKQQERLFQDFWLYFVVSKESLISDHANDFYLNTIAPNLPTLTSDSLTDHDLREFFYTSSLSKIKLTASKQNVLKTQILNFLNNTSDITLLVNKLTSPQILYLYSVCASEIIRIENSKEPSIESLFLYLTNSKLQKDKFGMWQCICKAAEEIFKSFLSRLRNKERDDSREAMLEKHVHLLLVYFNNVHSQIRHISDKFLSELIDSFPHMLWSRQVLWSVFDILSVLHDSLMFDSNDEISILDVPNSNYKIYLMDTKKAREEIFFDFAARSQEIILEAKKWAPDIINSHLQEYVIQGGKLFPHPIYHLQYDGARTLLHSNEKFNHEISDIIVSLSIRSRFIGEVAGLMEKSNLSSIEFGKTLAKEVWKACDTRDIMGYQICLQRATAFVVSQPSLQLELKQAIATSHVKFFTHEVMHTVIHCWYWVCTVKPDFELEFLMEMFEAWQYTLVNEIGLFSKQENNKNGAVSDDRSVIARPMDISNISQPHSIWLEFITQQISSSKYCCQNKLEMITSFLHNTLPINIGGVACTMSRSVESIIARFSILTSALSLLQADVSISCLEKVIIRQRIYYCCLDYFCCERRFPRRSGFHLKDSISLLIKFWYLLHSDKKHILKFTVSEPQDKIISTESTQVENKEQVDSRFIRLNSLGCTSLFNSFSVDFSRKRKLALCLLSEEIGFLSTWFDPSFCNGIEKVREWQSKFFNSNRLMNDFPTTAWNISPDLAVYLPARLRNDVRILSEISRMVLLNPAAVSHIPHAMLLLATSENLLANQRELVHLLTWAEATPLDILSLLSQNYPLNSFVLQYATRALLNCDANTLVFYIPQLVQLLRYDFLGYIHNLLTALSFKSPLFCHQLIWNIKANMYNDVNMISKSAIYSRLNALYTDVMNNLTGPAKIFCNREFEFIDQITDVSLKIPRNLKGEERKSACLRSLKNIKIHPGCYLPTSPDAIICDVDYNSGTPLQSKSRTPYLANFLVHRCSYNEVHEIGMEVSEKQLKGIPLEEIIIDDSVCSNKMWQRTIFKAADDVRQDMLALQTIQYLKDIFQEIDLDVFLFPYKVVAVAPGMGVIECIPNAHSRDQLGKQTNVGLYNYFVTTFGDEKSTRFQEAQRNFIKSVAAYSLVIFLFQIKDRHNANIMLDDVGHLMHIDFGFMFESSPGGNLGFEPDMKLTEEMVLIMGGKIEAEPFKRFTDLCIKAYLAARNHQEHIITLVMLMLDSGLPCFRGQTIKLLRGRFAPNASDQEAADYIRTVIRNSCFNFRTVTYDMLQYLQNSIQY